MSIEGAGPAACKFEQPFRVLSHVGRRTRQHYRGAFYHFIARGNDRNALFLSAQDRRAFERYLSEGVERFGHRCHAYCWMTNHVHMTVEVADVPLSQIAHNLLFRYARWFLKKNGRTGHLFERRYRAFLVETDDALRSLIRYIHLNPVRAEIVDNPRVYPWSSYAAYLDPGSRSPSWLTRSFALALFGRDASDARAELRAFTENEDRESPQSDEYQLIPCMGSKSTSTEPRAVNGRAPTRGAVLSGATLDQVLRAVSSACSVRPCELRADVQARAVVRARALASFLVRESPQLTLEELSAVVGREASTLSRAAGKIERLLAHDPEVRARLDAIESDLSRH